MGLASQQERSDGKNCESAKLAEHAIFSTCADHRPQADNKTPARRTRASFSKVFNCPLNSPALLLHPGALICVTL
jgi:hypothetical protein